MYLISEAAQCAAQCKKEEKMIENANPSKMLFEYNGHLYRLRFSYSPYDKVVTRATINERNSLGEWQEVSFAQVYCGGGTHGPIQKEVQRRKALKKLLHEGGFCREFNKALYDAYWGRGKHTSAGKYAVAGGAR